MSYKLREIEAESKFSQELKLEVLEHVVPLDMIKAVIASEGRTEDRECKLNMAVTVLFLIVMYFYSDLSMGEAMCKASKGLRSIWPEPDDAAGGASALGYRRYQSGA